MVTGLIGYAQPNAIDKIEIVEAFEAGFILLNFTGKEGGEKLEVKVTKKLSMPLIIVINEGTTTFEFGWDDKISIFTDREIKLDLSRKIEDSIVFPQTGTTRITGGSMSTKCFFGKNTAMVFKKIQYSQDQVIEGIIAALKDEDMYVRKGAVIALGEIGDERAVEPLIATLKDEDSNVRKNAAEALGKIGNERAVEPLKQALKDKSKDVQIWVAFGLYKLGDTQKIEFLITALTNEDGGIRRAAAGALGELKDPRAVEPLISALKDEDSNVRKNATKALLEITGEDFGQDEAKWRDWLGEE